MTEIKRFEVGKVYKSNRFDESILISKRTEKTIWFHENFISARISIENNVECICPNIGMIRPTYKAI